MDDEKLHKIIDFNDFEERFKIGSGSYLTNGSSEVDGLSSFPSKRFKKPENVSVLEHTRLRNIGKQHTQESKKHHLFCYTKNFILFSIFPVYVNNSNL